ncbi:acetyltransferase [Shewanella sp.]|uniref:acetyltransferase n=1 Tax=Shewanella sp. TaxID=50422 RepID=UPI00404784D6
MNSPNLVLIGAGGHANSCIDVIEQHGGYQIAGLIGMPEEINSRRYNYKVIGSDSDLPELVKKIPYALIALGQIKTSENRIKLFNHIKEIGFKLPVIIAPSAYVSRYATIGDGSIVMHCAVVNAGVNVGDNCIINSRALLEHDSKISDFCHISTGAIVNGNAKIGKGGFIGSGCIIKEGVSIGEDCVVGAGSVIRKNLPDNCQF